MGCRSLHTHSLRVHVATDHQSITGWIVAERVRPAPTDRPYAPGANDPVSGCPDDRVTKHAMNRSPWSHVAWSGA